MILNVEYEVKVFARVDTETGEVLDAFEDTDNIEPTGRVWSADFETICNMAHRVKRAQDIAENNDWPAWRRG